MEIEIEFRCSLKISKSVIVDIDEGREFQIFIADGKNVLHSVGVVCLRYVQLVKLGAIPFVLPIVFLLYSYCT